MKGGFFSVGQKWDRDLWPGMTIPVPDFTIGITPHDVMPTQDRLKLFPFVGMLVTFFDPLTFKAWLGIRATCKYCHQSSGVQSKGWNDCVIIAYTQSGLEGLYGRRYCHDKCPAATIAGQTTSWNSYDPDWISQQPECIRDSFEFYFNPGMCQIGCSLSNQ